MYPKVYWRSHRLFLTLSGARIFTGTNVASDGKAAEGRVAIQVSAGRMDGWWRAAIRVLRGGPLAGLWLFGWVFAAQLGHLIEHIAKAVIGTGLFGRSFDSELSHLLFNLGVAVLATLLVWRYPWNPWVYPLAAISVLHGIEHVYIFVFEYLRTGQANGPGLLGVGGAIGIVPLDRLDLHNFYNGFELILMTLGLWNETESLLTRLEGTD